MRHYRIRRCNGDRSAWALFRMNADGTECDANGSWTTSHSLDLLLAHAGHLTPATDDVVEFIWSPAPLVEMESKHALAMRRVRRKLGMIP